MLIQDLTLATCELWCIAPGHALGMAKPTATPIERRLPAIPYALVPIWGRLTKDRMVVIREHINALAANPDVAQIICLVDSPGGTVRGTHDLYLSISAAAKLKPVIAVVEDQATSGALYAIAGATEIVIGETALTGSVGVFAVYIDESKLLEQLGVEVLIIASGDHKGAGAQNTKLKPEQYAELKRRVDVQARHFTAVIAKGRRMKIDRAKDLSDGRVWIGREAIDVKLADRIGRLEDVIADAERAAHAADQRRYAAMQAQTAAEQACELQDRLAKTELRARLRPSAHSPRN
jgi:signal peptide peptidase SppA